MQVVVEILGKQFMVKAGDKITVDRMQDEVGTDLSFENVLLKVDGEKTLVGKPYLKEKVVAKVLEHKRGKKIRVMKYKSKVNYHKVMGFRSEQTVLEIVSI